MARSKNIPFLGPVFQAKAVAWNWGILKLQMNGWRNLRPDTTRKEGNS